MNTFTENFLKKMVIIRRPIYFVTPHLLCREANSVNLLDEDFFGFNSRLSLPVRKLKYCNCFSNERIKNLNQFLEMGIVLTPASWFRLQSALRLARNRLRKNNDTKNLSENISNFLSRIKKAQKNLDLS